MAATPRAGEPSWRTLLLLAGLSLVWGLNWPAMKFVLAEMPVLTFRLLCLWLTAPAMLLIARLGGERLGVPRRQWPALIAVSFFNVTVWYLCTGIALTLIPAGRAALLAYTMPVWVALFSALVLRERLGRRRLVGLLLGMAGIAVLLAPEAATLSTAPLGTLVILAAAIGWAFGVVLLKRFNFSRSVAQMTGWMLLLGGVPLAVAALLHDPPPRLLALPPATLAVFAYIIALPMIFGQWAWFKSLSRLPGTVAGISSLAVPAVGLLSSALLLGERLGLAEITALALVAAALGLVLVPGRRPVAESASGAGAAARS
ncbi:MAG TPA: DMT family transporter [Stellaceae bacterium]|nr:DMT family transporter [Stellaceae bacterium]